VKITLSGLEYHCHSPSLFELVVSPGHIPPRIGCQGPGCWQIGSGDHWGARLFGSRQEAAQFIADAFARAREGLAL
jgi:hypothetical protein